jgi:hypothetical protein
VIGKITANHTFDKDAIRNGAADFYALDNAVKKYEKVYGLIFNKDTE